jgi:3-carboxy-cis,cis-muconate cycloisomerase
LRGQHAKIGSAERNRKSARRGKPGKIAYDLMLMSATEFGEAAEPFVQGRGSSSTMPQKRNPISCELILAAAKVRRQHAGLVLDAVVADFERATGRWHVEWVALLEAFGYAAGALHQARFMLGGLIVDTDRMAKNLAMTHGLIVAEAVMMGLAPYTWLAPPPATVLTCSLSGEALILPGRCTIYSMLDAR